ncbi:MAG: aminotransferase class I/II-fold pyridoxal phosphate-dependent enzyme [Prolixibacteraceae bacterium]|nr:aminotransferase class I/II-fold pyridoxal phosphate-dependent enzyme [Prolixibacteraceae bacterium]MBN2648456.1 aminotransferase class I/II-fold pyridoxal phosphate-dependent enzyme [Prolixibacteraceae bacterium]
MLNGHGNDQYAYNRTITADFSTNITNGAVAKGLVAFLKTKLNTLHNYPDPEANIFLGAIAKHHHIEKENLLACNGSTEAFYLIAQTFSNNRSFIRIPSFSEYEDACKQFGHHIEQDVALPEKSLNNNKLVWLGNPNNPDGRTTSTNEIDALCRLHPKTLFIVDEAYSDLCQNFETAIPLTQKYSNLIVIRSLTKSFSVPGLRIGYLVSARRNIKKIKQNMMPWNMNTLAIEAGAFIMNNYKKLIPDTEKIIQESKRFQEELSRLPALTVLPTSCNFFLVKTNIGTAAGLKSFLIENYGILIRDASNFKGLSNQHFRLSVQSEQNNRELISALKEWFMLKQQ